MNYSDFKDIVSYNQQFTKQAGLFDMIGAAGAGAIFGGAAGALNNSDPVDSARQGAGTVLGAYLGKDLGQWAANRQVIKSLVKPTENTIGRGMAAGFLRARKGAKPGTWMANATKSGLQHSLRRFPYLTAPLVLLTALGGASMGAQFASSMGQKVNS